jgi:uncharacterized membrane protein YphA (DoxX/SURF4 family)
MDHQDQKEARWPPARLFAFRFAFVYLVLYNLPSPLGYLPYTRSLGERYELLWQKVVPWFAKHILHLSHQISYSPYEGDTPYEYVKVLCFLTLALTSAIVWLFSDRSRENHAKLQRWLFVYVRIVVGAAMISYGAGKIFQRQFVDPDLYKLLQPHGKSSLMDLLWTFMGASGGYRVFTGCIELLCGIFLFIPRLATLGALIGAAALANIFALNVFYGVWVKLYSFHLFFMCIFLLLPQTQQFLNFLVLNRTAEPAPETPLFNRKRLNTGALVLQLLLAVFLVSHELYQSHDVEKQKFASRPPFYGIWMVDEFTLAGKIAPPLLTDTTRWQRVIFEYPNGVGVQSMSGSWTGYRLRRDMEKKTFAMENRDATKKFAFTFVSPEAQSLALEGTDGTNPISVSLHRVDEKQFTLLDQKIHWISEDPD